jgi:capsular polysaccharide biosynthesis protein
LHFVGKTAGQGSPVLGTTCHPKDISTIKNYFDANSNSNTSKNYAKHFYFSRRGASRSPSNELDLVYELKKMGFQEFHEGLDLDIYEQYSLLSQAEKVIGIHGASLSHIAWIKSGSEVIEMHADYIPACYSILSSIGKLKYRSYKYGNEFQNKINIEEFISMLNKN